MATEGWNPKRCELTGCAATFPVGRGIRPRRFCKPHRDRPWYELRARRAELGLTVDEVSQRSGVPKLYLYQLLRGARSPSEQHVAQVAAGLGVDVVLLTPHADTAVPAPVAETA